MDATLAGKSRRACKIVMVASGLASQTGCSHANNVPVPAVSPAPRCDSRYPQVTIGPVCVHDILRGQIIDELAFDAPEPRLIANVNAHAMNLALKDPEFLRILNSAHVCFCDGFGVKVLAQMYGRGTIRDRTTMPGFVEEVVARLHGEGKRIFLLGDEPGVAQAYGRKLEAQWPGVVAGSHHGFILRDPVVEAEALRLIRESAPNVVAVGMGMPLQEKWISHRMHDLPPARYMPVGAHFAWSTQSRKRGPAWATDNGLEWLFRVLYEPRRMWKRYLIGLPEVTARVGFWYLRNRGHRHE
jgi:N-acetylglucosaminyldiphosphoundecaprenol N-acetyl-beta-D-mannosaminyltransferase